MVNQLKQLGECKVGKVLIAVERAIVDNSLILDCSATTYMFAEKVYFKLLKPKKPGNFVTIGGHN